jgi:hypothetical protein
MAVCADAIRSSAGDREGCAIAGRQAMASSVNMATA